MANNLYTLKDHYYIKADLAAIRETVFEISSTLFQGPDAAAGHPHPVRVLCCVVSTVYRHQALL